MSITKSVFTQMIHQLPDAKSIKRGKRYTLYGVRSGAINFKREGKMQKPPEELPIDELWAIYNNVDVIDTVSVKPYIKKWMYSPACAILTAAGIYSKGGLKQL
jgi:hypothetical protein